MRCPGWGRCIGGCPSATIRRPISGECSAGGGIVPPRLAEQERAMRKGFLGSIAALAAGAGAAWGQPGGPPSAPPAGTAIVAPGPVGPIGPPPPVTPPAWGGFPANAIPGNSGYAPPPVILPPGNYGPPGDPLGLGP